MIVRVDLKRIECGHIQLNVNSIDEAKGIMEDGVFDEDDVVVEHDYNEGWEVDGIDEIAFKIMDNYNEV